MSCDVNRERPALLPGRKCVPVRRTMLLKKSTFYQHLSPLRLLSHGHAGVKNLTDVHVWLPRVHTAPYCQHGRDRRNDGGESTPDKELELIWSETPGDFPHLNEMQKWLTAVVHYNLRL
jgi:hypothetical protein